MLKTLPCQSGDFEVCQIRPSAMFFTQTKMAEQVKERAVNATLINASNVEKYKLRVKRRTDLFGRTVKCKRLRLLLAMTELSVSAREVLTTEFATAPTQGIVNFARFVLQ